jgi:hypothetical protein
VMKSPSFALTLVVAAVFALAPLAGFAKEPPRPKPAPTKAWDQAAVTSLAQKLAQAANQLYSAYYAMPGSGGQVGSGDAYYANRLENDLQVLQEMTLGLAGELQKGKGRIETTPQFEDIGEKAYDAKTMAAFVFDQSPVVDRAEAARKIWLQLQPYYGVPEPKH